MSISALFALSFCYICRTLTATFPKDANFRRYLLFVLTLLSAMAPSVHAGAEIWTTHGFASGLVRSIAADDGGHIYAGTQEGFFKSGNGGMSWTRAASDVIANNEIVDAIAIDTTGVAYAAAVNFANSRYVTSLYRSTDHGGNWTVVNSTANNAIGSFYAFLVFDASGNMYAGTDRGLYKSADNGNSWAMISNGPLSGGLSTMTFDSGGNYYVGTQSGVFKSVDGGNSWSALNSGPLATSTWINGLVIDANGDIFAITNGSGVFKSSNGGTSWAAVNNGLTQLALYSFAIITDKNGNLFMSTLDGSFASNDAAKTWRQVNAGISTSISGASFSSNNAETIYLGTMGAGVYKSTDGAGTWTPVNNGLPEAYFAALQADTAGAVYAGTAAGFYKSTDGGNNWVSVNDNTLQQSDTVGAVTIDPQGNIYAAALRYYNNSMPGLGVYKSSNGGASWTSINRGLEAGNGAYLSVTALAADTRGNIYAGTSGNGVYYSPNGGEYWYLLADGNVSSNDYISSLAIDATGNVFAGTQHGVCRMAPGTYSWVQMGSTPVFPGEPSGVSALLVDSQTILYAGLTSGRIFKTANNGITWQQVDQNLYGGAISTLAQDSHGNLYAGTSSSLSGNGAGLYRSSDHGNSWQLLNDSNLTGANPINTIAVAGNGTILAGTSSGVYQLTLSGSDGSVASITGSASGPNNALKLVANITVASADAGNLGQLYIAANLPSGATRLYILGASGWEPYNGQTIPAALSDVTLGSNTINVLNGTLDVSGLVGTSIIAGYGLNETDLLNNQKFAVIYTIH